MQRWINFISWAGTFIVLGGFTFSIGLADVTSAAEAARVATAQPLRVAIGEFTGGENDSGLPQFNRALTELLTVELARDPNFEIIERQELDRILKETELTLSGTSKNANLLKVGKLLRANWLLLGSVQWMETNKIALVKIVDLQTGIIRDLAAVKMTHDTESSSKAIAEFVRNSALMVTSTKPRQFLGIGQFENIGITNHFPDFGRNLRAVLEQAYRGTTVSVVERSSINPIQTELRLNLLGLTQATGTSKAAQPAFLLIDGMYQEMQDEKFKVSILLRVQQVGTKPVQYSITEAPGKLLYDKIIAAINAGFSGMGTNTHSATSKDEALLQFTRGKELSGLWLISAEDSWLGGYFIRSSPGKRFENISAAIKAFEAALLLDPDHEEAKTRLAICLDSPDIKKHEAARDYFYEIFAGSTNEALVEFARSRLEHFYSEQQDTRGLALLSVEAATNRVLSAMRTKAERVGKPMSTLPATERVAFEQALETERKKIRSECRDDEKAWKSGSTIYTYGRLHKHFGEIYAASNKNTNNARQYIDKLLSELTSEFPSLETYFLGTYLVWAREASPAHQKRLEHLLDELGKQPAQLQDHQISNRALFEGIAESALAARYYALARKAGLLHRKVVGQKSLSEAAKRVDIYLAYCDREEGNWQKAREAFESLGHLDMRLEANGPWGKAPFYFKAEQAAYECRQRLGIAGPPPAPAPKPKKEPPIQFALGTPVLRMAEGFVFACDGGNIWLGDGIVPFVWNKSDATAKEIEAPDDIERNITCIAPGKSSVWFGTAGSGLIEFDKASKRSILHREALFLPNIMALYFTEQRLWVGYGKRENGALGYLDFQKQKFYGMTAELDTNSVQPFAFSGFKDSVQMPFEIPPKGKVVGIAQSSPEELWLAEQDGGIRRYSFLSKTWNLRDHEWNSFNNGIVGTRNLRLLAVTPDYVIFGADSYGGELAIHERKRKETRLVNVKEWLPEWVMNNYRFKGFSALAVDGDHLWAGGEGFLALIDLASTRVEQLCDLRNGHVRVHGLQVDGKDVWVGAEKGLYRLPRHDHLVMSHPSKGGAEVNP